MNIGYILYSRFVLVTRPPVLVTMKMTTMTTMTTSLLLLLLLSTVQLQVSALPNPSWPLENVDALYYTMRSV